MPLIHGFDPPERFVTGTVGEPGQRTFFLQARSGARITSVSLEKQQVAALSERIDQLLDEVMTSDTTQSVIPAVAPLGLEDSEPLEQPIEEEFRAGTMTLSWDPDDERVVIEVFPYTEAAVVSPEQLDEELTEPEPDEVFLIRIDAGSARAFVKRAEQVLEAGRPTCPFCGNPIDPEGHLCVRANGFRRRDPEGRERAARPLSSNRASSSSTAGSCRRPTPPSWARSARSASSTSRSRGSGRCGTSRSARSPTARWRPAWSPRRSAGTSYRPPGCGRGRTAPGWSRCGRSRTPSRRR